MGNGAGENTTIKFGGISRLLVGSDVSLGRSTADQLRHSEARCSVHGGQEVWLFLDEERFCIPCIKELLRRSLPVLEDGAVTSES